MNSATHMWGSQRFATRDSRNNLVGRAFDLRRRLAQQSSRASAVSSPRLAWYEIDFNWYGIWALKKLGLAWQIQKVNLTEIEQGLIAAPNGNLIVPQFTD